MRLAGRRVECGLLLAILGVQVMILIQFRTGGFRTAFVLPGDIGRGGENVQAPVAAPALRTPHAWVHEIAEMLEDTDASRGGRHSAVHFKRGWDMMGVTPTMDMRDTGGGYQIVFSIPGATPENIGVELDGQVLTVRALCKGMAVGRFGWQRYERRVLLPGPVGGGAVQTRASLTNGILSIHLPKGTPAGPHGAHTAVMRLF